MSFPVCGVNSQPTPHSPRFQQRVEIWMPLHPHCELPHGDHQVIPLRDEAMPMSLDGCYITSIRVMKLVWRNTAQAPAPASAPGI